MTMFRIFADTGVQAGSQDVSELSREAVGNAVRDALHCPNVGPLGGRPRQNGQVVEKLVVFQEAHQDGSKHFHVAVTLSSQQRFAAAKRAMKIRHCLPSHRYCSTQLGSARLRSAWLGSARFGSARLGSAWLGSARLSSAGLGCPRSLCKPSIGVGAQGGHKTSSQKLEEPCEGLGLSFDARAFPTACGFMRQSCNNHVTIM